MENNQETFLKSLLITFRNEAKEHIKTLSAGLLALENIPGDETQREIIEEIFRAAHSLKGAAKAVNFVEMESLCHALESVFSIIQRNELDLTQSLFDLLHDVVDAVDKLLSFHDNKPEEKETIRINALIKRLDEVVKNKIVDSSEELSKQPPEITKAKSKSLPKQKRSSSPPIKHILSDTVRISRTKLDTLLCQVEELLAIKLAATQRIGDIQGLLNDLFTFKKEQTKLESVKKILQQSVSKTTMVADSRMVTLQLTKLLAFTDLETDFVKSFDSQLEALAKSSEQDQRCLTMMVNGLLENMKQVLMQPISTTLALLPKLIRDVSRAQGKNIRLKITGADTEIDRRILEEMYNPLIHIVRNCIDHGIESPDVRKSLNKPEQGTITIAITRKDAGTIEILVSDDGAGINQHAIQDTAQKLGLISQSKNHHYNEKDLLPLIFQSGVSTSPAITDLSGRGLGLAIVWEKTEKLGGNVTVESTPNLNTTFRILLPLTLAMFRGVFVRVNRQQFIFPTAQVEQCLRLRSDMVKSVENKDSILWQGEIVSLVSLSDVLEMPYKQLHDTNTKSLQVLILGEPGKRIAFCVDEILGEEDVLVKNLSKQLSRVRNITGATLLGNGKVVPILHIADLLRSALKVGSTPQLRTNFQEQETKSAKKTVLVVEDSITSRMLLKNILESAGYNVETAVDGLQGLNRLRADPFDIVLSDVDMPRMNGFELTEKIRADKKYAQLPVVLVTSMDSRADRERGADAGANAYIAKSHFDESNLLDVVRRLL